MFQTVSFFFCLYTFLSGIRIPDKRSIIIFHIQVVPQVLNENQTQYSWRKFAKLFTFYCYFKNLSLQGNTIAKISVNFVGVYLDSIDVGQPVWKKYSRGFLEFNLKFPKRFEEYFEFYFEIMHGKIQVLVKVLTKLSHTFLCKSLSQKQFPTLDWITSILSMWFKEVKIQIKTHPSKPLQIHATFQQLLPIGSCIWCVPPLLLRW